MVHDSPDGTGYNSYVTDPDEVSRAGGHLLVRSGDRWFNVHPPAPRGSICDQVAPGAYWVRWELRPSEVAELGI